MIDGYLSLVGDCVTQKIIEKSKFIATSRHVCGEEEARAFISEISQKYSDATHNCYAYIADNLGNFPRFSDDGEPQGTAGMPMLEVLKSNGLYETAVVVTRYFGGIKLGAGGLVRAYSGAVAENIAAAQKAMYEMCSEVICTVGYPAVDGALKFCKEFGANILSTNYENDVKLTAAFKKRKLEEFERGLLNFLNGRVTFEKTREYFHPFSV